MREYRGSVHIHLVLDGNVVAQDRDVLDSALFRPRNPASQYERSRSTGRGTYPSAHSAIPPDDRARNPGVIPDGRVAHDDTSLKSSTGADLDSRTEDDVGANKGGSVEGVMSAGLGTGMDDKERTHGWTSAVCEQGTTNV